MNDWKSIPAISTNAFAVANLANKTMRIVFGETLGKPEDVNFHGAVLINRESAKLLITLLQEALAQPESGGGPEGGGHGVVMGSTSVH